MSETKPTVDLTAVVSVEQMKGWIQRFRFYRDPPDEVAIQAWLAAFDEAHRATAAKVLDNVVVVSERDIQLGYYTALGALEGWHRDPAQRQGRWYFLGFGGPGESGLAMLRSFREANDLTDGKYHPLFKSLADLPHLQLTAADHVVFVDDFAGTGDQVARLWPTIAELIASEATCYLLLTALTGKAEQAILGATELQVHARYRLTSENSLFDEDNALFSEDEKTIVAGYCQRADARFPKGYGDLGVMFVLHHKTPNNALPVLYANTDDWCGLFPRVLRIAA